ncbi:unnamed protein product [Closterium sp. Naga37s-1]|nr:unnamed protein product [Closterium sp. Naga37s-1]
MASLQPFDLTEFLQLKEAVRPEQAENAAGQTAAAVLPASVAETCRAMAECLRATSALIVRDPRCAQADNDRFLDMMESYFAQPKATKLAHSRPELHYQSALDEAVKARMAQLRAHSGVLPLTPASLCPLFPVCPPSPHLRSQSPTPFARLGTPAPLPPPSPAQVGVTPEGVEMPQSALDDAVKARMAQLPADSRPHAPSGPDCKWRFMWRVGPRPAHTRYQVRAEESGGGPTRTRYQELNASPVVPEGFPQWASVMDGWGCKMTAAVEAVAEMLAIGFDLPQDSFTTRMHMGPHLLAPTGSDLGEHGSPGTVLAGYHADLNFLTIHGRCRFPGLRIWLRDGTCCRVSVPDDCLLLQAGKQMEWLTGGEVSAGMHEVVVDEGTVAAVQRAQQQGCSLWRVSSTVFAHIASDEVLTPIGHFATSKLAPSFPPKPAGEFVEEELAAIQLKTTSGGG